MGASRGIVMLWNLGGFSSRRRKKKIVDRMRHENILCMGDFTTAMYPSEKLDRLEDFTESMHEFMFFLAEII